MDGLTSLEYTESMRLTRQVILQRAMEESKSIPDDVVFSKCVYCNLGILSQDNKEMHAHRYENPAYRKWILQWKRMVGETAKLLNTSCVYCQTFNGTVE